MKIPPQYEWQFISALVTLYITWRQAVSPGQRSLFYPSTTRNKITLGRGSVYVVIFTNFLCLVSFIIFWVLMNLPPEGNVSIWRKWLHNIPSLMCLRAFFLFNFLDFLNNNGQRAKFTHFSHQTEYDSIHKDSQFQTVFWISEQMVGQKSIEFREHSELFDN